ncbi:Insulin-like growth factor binding protein, N-terminal [Pseudocohnilembus persalinus]|uniref:Insulin-like growth factor binding protein, N-terminal n=1 Tax=Pseudocohnilembus persalinus TaxID=266149 RepID=A0A0V0QPW1_PSEPJ|nr:Insulin-like growth factor binding protein, N-terminal [Pseudocohnilembus persalinus]|eukprot:KRX04016.1 Insulin-like growth factor binding protein, N-terminal [Pseudocohnilembus persalinus]
MESATVFMYDEQIQYQTDVNSNFVLINGNFDVSYKQYELVVNGFINPYASNKKNVTISILDDQYNLVGKEIIQTQFKPYSLQQLNLIPESKYTFQATVLQINFTNFNIYPVDTYFKLKLPISNNEAPQGQQFYPLGNEYNCYGQQNLETQLSCNFQSGELYIFDGVKQTKENQGEIFIINITDFINPYSLNIQSGFEFYVYDKETNSIIEQYLDGFVKPNYASDFNSVQINPTNEIKAVGILNMISNDYLDITYQDYIINITNCFPQYLYKTTIQFQIQNILNQNYIKDPERSFQIYLYDGEDFQILKRTQNLIYQLEPGDITNINLQFSNNQVSSQTKLQIQFTLTNSLTNNGWLQIQIPSQLNLDDQIEQQCNESFLIQNLSQNSICSIKNNQINITQTFDLQTPKNYDIIFEIQNLQTPQTNQTTDSFIISSFEGQYLIDKQSKNIKATFQPQQIQLIDFYSENSQQTNQISNYLLSFDSLQNPFLQEPVAPFKFQIFDQNNYMISDYIDQTGIQEFVSVDLPYVDISLDSHYISEITQYKFQLQNNMYFSGFVQIVFPESIQIQQSNCIFAINDEQIEEQYYSCDLISSVEIQINFLNGFEVVQNSKILIVIKQVKNSYQSGVNVSDYFQIFTYNKQGVQVEKKQIFTGFEYICEQGCSQCQHQKDNCNQCEQNYELKNENKCQKSCEKGYYLKGESCVECNIENCKECEEDSCTKCVEGYYLLQKNDEQKRYECKIENQYIQLEIIQILNHTQHHQKEFTQQVYFKRVQPLGQFYCSLAKQQINSNMTLNVKIRNQQFK